MLNVRHVSFCVNFTIFYIFPHQHKKFNYALVPQGLSGGDYTVVINCSAGCNATQTITVNSQLGIHGDQGGNLAIYPNPTSNLVPITLEGLFVYSLVGGFCRIN